MKNIFVHLLSFGLLMVFYSTARAQNTDSISNAKENRDSIYDKKIKVAKGYRVYKQQDSLIYISRKKELFKAYARQDSLYKTRALLSKRTDTLKKLNKVMAIKSDSLRKLYALSARLDSFHQYNSFQRRTSDSLKKLIYLQQIKTDSQRIKLYLQQKKLQLQKFYKDTVVIRQGFSARKLSMEITCNEGDTVYINNHYKKLLIKTIASQKLRLSTTFYYKEALNENDAQIFQKMGIGLSRTNSSVTAMINGTKRPPVKNTDELCPDEKVMENNAAKALLIELPGNTIIVVNSKYAETNIENFVTNLKAEILNGSLKLGNADRVQIKSNYGTVKAGEIANADLNLSSTDFSASNIVSMSVVSNLSTIKLDKCSSMNMTSISDDYNIDNAGSIRGNKNFGKLQIEHLRDQLVLTGTSADIKIDNLSYEAPFIKIENKYAELKLSLYNQKDYVVYYEGSYRDVNKLSTATQSLKGMGSITARLSVAGDTLAGMGSQAKVNKTTFEAVAGNITGRHTKIDIVCPFCNVFFN